ncbi:caspase family protein [Paraburkholderia sp. UYCP14C]|uniref:caspase family protein n=1 Tax=Paraburkholderia sp. UYCP14C TaxID=2511130 RepID=UPI002691002E
MHSAKSCVVLLGASMYPDYTDLNNPSLLNSAMALKKYFLKTAEMNVERKHFLDLYNSKENNTRQMQLMGEHIERFNHDAGDELQNVFIIYLGHGLPQSGTTSLSIAATTKSATSLTALKVQDLADELKKLAAWSRRFVILDCCYAAGALKVFLDEDGGLVQTAEQAFDTHEREDEQENPTRGTTVLCAADKYSKAKAPSGELYTLFSGLLLDVLRNGKSGGPSLMTFGNIVQIISDKLRKMHEGPTPVLVSPDQTEGDLGHVLRLFPNPAQGQEKKIENRSIFGQQISKPNNLGTKVFLGTMLIAFLWGIGGFTWMILKGGYFRDNVINSSKEEPRTTVVLGSSSSIPPRVASIAGNRLLVCQPTEMLNGRGTLLVATPSINISDGKAKLSFSSKSTGYCAPKGNEASNLMFQLTLGGAALTPFQNAEPAWVADRLTVTPHVVDVTDRFAPAYWEKADGCEITMPGEAHCD